MDKLRHILVVRLSAMGDVAMTVPVLLNLQKQYPNLRITVLTNGFFAPMFSRIPNVTVYPAKVKTSHKGLIGLWKLYRELKRLPIDVVLDLHDVLRSNILNFFFRLSGTPIVQIDKGRAEKKMLTAWKSKQIKQLKTTHERYAAVFEDIGFPLQLDAKNVLPGMPLNQDLLGILDHNKQKKIGVAPFASFPGKQYPFDLVLQVVEEIAKNRECELFFFGGGNEEKTLLDALAEHSGGTSLVGKLKFSEELALISNLDVMLAMDSGNAHLAAMFGIPVVSIWGVTHPFAGFYPFGTDPDLALIPDRNRFPFIPTSVYGNKVPEGYENAIASISPGKVVQKIREVLEVC